jgi:Rps23 Pro-64 3,4-dihydroxylase Tpa1-like proline 4-hydroxylase
MDGLLNSQRSLDRTLITEYNQFNCQYYMIQPKAGRLVLFMGDTPHMVAPNDGAFVGRRLSVAGDVSLVLKREHSAFEVGKPSLDVWKQF